MSDKSKRAKRSKEKAKSYRKSKNNKPLSFPEITTQQIDEQKKEPRQYFGYAKEAQQDKSPFELPETGMICMVAEVLEPLVGLRNHDGAEFKVGEWFLSEVITEHEFIIHGPFVSEIEAFAFGEECLGVYSFLSKVRIAD